MTLTVVTISLFWQFLLHLLPCHDLIYNNFSALNALICSVLFVKIR